MRSFFLIGVAYPSHILCLTLMQKADDPKPPEAAGSVPSGMIESFTNGMSQQRSVTDSNLFLNMLHRYKFEDFVHEYGRSYTRGTAEWIKREQVFEENKKHVINFYLGPRRSWRLGVTEFLDYTRAEFKGLLGYRRDSAKAGIHTPSVSVVRVQPVAETVVHGINETGLSGFIRDQGSCGSCWAMAATSVLEAHMEKNPEIMLEVNKRQSQVLAERENGAEGLATLSSQTILSCSANPKHCGGKGGCDGATVQLAYEMVKEHGIPLAKHWSYLARDQACLTSVFQNSVLGITGYEELPKNQLDPLKRALVVHGPVAVAVAASEWSFYMDGVMSDESASTKDKFLLNHAVVLFGYNAEASQKYWNIKNSWGNSWGENGNIRIEMKSDEGKHCGWDEDTHVGMACDGDADKDWACGTFGILYNGVYPKGLHLKPAQAQSSR